MRIVELVESVESQRIDENLLKTGLGWLAKSAPFFKGGADTAVKTGQILAKPALGVAKGVANTVVKPAAFGAGLGAGAIGGAYYAGKDAINKLYDWGKSIVEKIPEEVLTNIKDAAAKYGIPLLAAVAIVYGGKKVYDWLSSDDKEKEIATMESYFAERGAATRALCLSKRSDASIGASALSSCKSQGLRPRDGKKSHKLGKKRVEVGGRKIKGKAHGGPLPDWS